MNNKELTKITEKYLKETDSNIIGVSYGYNIVNGKFTDEKVISFIVKDKIPENKLSSSRTLPKLIEHNGQTFKTDVIKGKIKLADASFCYNDHYTWWEYWQPIPDIPTNRNKFRPLKGGISVTNYNAFPNVAGTLGFIAIDNDTESIVGVSCNHVLIDDAFIVTERTSDDVVTNISNHVSTQPNETLDNGIQNRIGKIKRYKPITTTGTNTVDGALVAIDYGMIDINESWKQEGLTISSPLPFATTSEIDNILTTNPLLYSSGRTSGAKGESDTKLLISYVGAAIDVPFNRQGVDINVTFSDTIAFIASGATTTPGDVCLFPVAEGDSGSALIADFGGTKKIIGVVFATLDVSVPIDESTNVDVPYLGFACRIDNIASQLNISAWDGSVINYSYTDNISEVVVSGRTDVESFEKDGKMYYQAGLTNSKNIGHTLP